MKLSYKSFSLPFRHPFTISKGTKTHQPTLVVALQHFGHIGYGEAPAIAYYDITVEKMIEDIERKKTFIEKICFHRTGTLLALSASPFTRKSVSRLRTGYSCMGFVWKNEQEAFACSLGFGWKK
ncbi:MAG: hypothetical protein NVV59_10715 [Chitinophagaceae bacterium]|nr:hypothetical protein [Chitinophagaceae bacterium]